MLRQASTEGTPHIAYCGGDFGRVSLMAADTELADHARDCVQFLVNVHPARLDVRVDGATRALRPFDAMVIAPRQTYAIPRQPAAALPAAPVGFLLVKADRPRGAPPRPLAGAAPLRALTGAARDDAEQLVAELMADAPAAVAVARGVGALEEAMAPVLDRMAAAGGKLDGVHARIAREAEAARLDDALAFGGLPCRAAAYGVSERHFLTLFRRATRLAPRAFYNMRRLEAAFALLGDPARTVADIGYELGFSAPPHFTRFMRANTGWTPSAYRAHLQGLPPPLRPRWSHALPAGRILPHG